MTLREFPTACSCSLFRFSGLGISSLLMENLMEHVQNELETGSVAGVVWGITLGDKGDFSTPNPCN